MLASVHDTVAGRRGPGHDADPEHRDCLIRRLAETPSPVDDLGSVATRVSTLAAVDRTRDAREATAFGLGQRRTPAGQMGGGIPDQHAVRDRDSLPNLQRFC